jgi:hypothetical protein
MAAAHHHGGADRDPIVEVEDLLIQQADASTRHLLAYGPRLVGAVNAAPLGRQGL